MLDAVLENIVFWNSNVAVITFTLARSAIRKSGFAPLGTHVHSCMIFWLTKETHHYGRKYETLSE